MDRTTLHGGSHPPYRRIDRIMPQLRRTLLRPLHSRHNLIVREHKHSLIGRVIAYRAVAAVQHCDLAYAARVIHPRNRLRRRRSGRRRVRHRLSFRCRVDNFAEVGGERSCLGCDVVRPVRLACRNQYLQQRSTHRQVEPYQVTYLPMIWLHRSEHLRLHVHIEPARILVVPCKVR